MSCTAFWAVHTLHAMKLTDVGFNVLRNWWEKTWRKWGQPSLLSKVKTRKVSRVCCDVTSHNLIPSGVIWGLVGERDMSQSSRVDRFPKSSYNLQLWKGNQFFLISEILHFVFTLRFPKHARSSRSNYQNGMTDSYWTQWNAGQIGSKCLSNFFEQRWNPIHEGQHPKLQH